MLVNIPGWWFTSFKFFLRWLVQRGNEWFICVKRNLSHSPATRTYTYTHRQALTSCLMSLSLLFSFPFFHKVWLSPQWLKLQKTTIFVSSFKVCRQCSLIGSGPATPHGIPTMFWSQLNYSFNSSFVLGESQLTCWFVVSDRSTVSQRFPPGWAASAGAPCCHCCCSAARPRYEKLNLALIPQIHVQILNHQPCILHKPYEVSQLGKSLQI